LRFLQVSVGRPLGSDCAVPADLLLLSGACVVNEAVLTGESTPQWKSAIDTRDDHEVRSPPT
jgi:cation-transporting ATPase 13A1